MNALADKRHPLDSFSWKRSPLVFGLVLFGIVLRGVCLMVVETGPLSPSETTYASLAATWSQVFRLEHEGASTAEVMPVYPMLLGLFHLFTPDSWAAVRFFQGILGGATCWFAFRIAWRLSRNAKVAWGTLVLSLFFPPLILLPLHLEPGLLAGFFVAVGLWILTSVLEENLHLVYFVAAAVAFSLATYTSPSVLFIVPVVGFWAGVRAYYPGVGVACAIVFCMASLVLLMPWAGRNFLATGRMIPLTTGYAQPLDESLAKLTGQSVAGGTSGQPPSGTGESFEVLQYQEALASSMRRIEDLRLASLGKLTVRGLGLWVSLYETAGPNPSGQKGWMDTIAVRAVLLTGVILMFVLALVGWVRSLPYLDVWLVWLMLATITFLGAILDADPLWALPYWPFFALFLSWGGWTVWNFMAKTGLLERKPKPHPQPSGGFQESPRTAFGDSERESHFPERKEPPVGPLWPPERPLEQPPSGSQPPIRSGRWKRPPGLRKPKPILPEDEDS